jgi:hypothetical protein
MKAAAKKIWKITWRIGVCLLLLGWIFQAIFYDEGRQAGFEAGKDWTHLTRVERFQLRPPIRPTQAFGKLCAPWKTARSSSLSSSWAPPS